MSARNSTILRHSVIVPKVKQIAKIRNISISSSKQSPSHLKELIFDPFCPINISLEFHSFFKICKYLFHKCAYEKIVKNYLKWKSIWNVIEYFCSFKYTSFCCCKK